MQFFTFNTGKEQTFISKVTKGKLPEPYDGFPNHLPQTATQVRGLLGSRAPASLKVQAFNNMHINAYRGLSSGEIATLNSFLRPGPEPSPILDLTPRPVPEIPEEHYEPGDTFIREITLSNGTKTTHRSGSW